MIHSHLPSVHGAYNLKDLLCHPGLIQIVIRTLSPMNDKVALCLFMPLKIQIVIRIL